MNNFTNRNNKDFTNYLLDNYPNSTSLQHYKMSFNNDWYPLIHYKFGYAYCPCCTCYRGVRQISEPKYHCGFCDSIFLICNSCIGYCQTVKYNKIEMNKIYNYIPKLNLSLIKIIHRYSSFESLYSKSNRSEFKCRRCNNRVG
jgi:hypothetical protein